MSSMLLQRTWRLSQCIRLPIRVITPSTTLSNPAMIAIQPFSSSSPLRSSQDDAPSPTSLNAPKITGGSLLEQFRDPLSPMKRSTEIVGRSWSVKELRRKSFDDLHRLWYVLYKERNMLLTEKYIASLNSNYLPQPERERKIKKSMGAIKHVMGEREIEQAARDAALQESMEGEEIAADVVDGNGNEKEDSRM